MIGEWLLIAGIACILVSIGIFAGIGFTWVHFSRRLEALEDVLVTRIDERIEQPMAPAPKVDQSDEALAGFASQHWCTVVRAGQHAVALSGQGQA